MKPGLKLIFLLFLYLCRLGSALAGDSPDPDIKVVLFPVGQAVLSAGIEGLVQEVKLREGESFAKQALLAHLDERPLQLAESIARSGLLDSQAKLRFSGQELARLSELHQRKLTGDRELEEARLQKETAEAKAKIMEAELNLARYRLEQCRVLAPFAGRLVKIDAHSHEYVRPGQPLLEIIEDRKLLAVMHLDSKQLARIHPQMSVKIRIDETGTEHSGVPYSQGAAVDPGSRSFEFKILIDNAEQKLRAGMSGTVTGW
ncbi:MAG: efflux RND transporter periplasmic adaptor subunit [Pseudomonadota bacterium]